MAVAEQEKQFIIMKKSILMFATLFVTTAIYAQITLEHTFSKNAKFGWGIEISDGATAHEGDRVIGNYIYDEQGNTIMIYDAADCSLVKQFTQTDGITYALISQGFFTTDNRWSYVVFEKTNERTDIEYEPCAYYFTVKVMTEDGETLATLANNLNCENFVQIAKIGDSYKLIVEHNNYANLDVYSLPGNGNATAVSTPSSPKRSARKIARDGQVLVQTDANTYTLTGAEVK